MEGIYILETIIGIVSVFVTFILGIIAKKHPKIDNRIIPIQNLIIGIVTAVIYYIITKDVSLVLSGVGLFTGGVYDILNNLKKIVEKESD